MNKMKEQLLSIAKDNKIPVSGNNIQQTYRNKLRRTIVSALKEFAEAELAEEDWIDVYLTADGVVLRLNNERTGFISVVLDASIKNLTYEAADDAEAYELKLVEDERKAAEAAKAKELKIKASMEARARKLAEKARAIQEGLNDGE